MRTPTSRYGATLVFGLLAACSRAPYTPARAFSARHFEDEAAWQDAQARCAASPRDPIVRAAVAASRARGERLEARVDATDGGEERAALRAPGYVR